MRHPSHKSTESLPVAAFQGLQGARGPPGPPGPQGTQVRPIYSQFTFFTAISQLLGHCFKKRRELKKKRSRIVTQNQEKVELWFCIGSDVNFHLSS